MKTNKTILALLMSTISGGAMAHGFISLSDDGFAGRAALCNSEYKEGQTQNTNCDGVEWEPQSVEGEDGFPSAGPADGMIANAGMSRFLSLNEQSESRWTKLPIKSGTQTFEWIFTAPHPIQDFKYYITKEDWDANSVLTRESFDLNPFCVVEGNGVVPPRLTEYPMECDVPEREGYNVILAVWDVQDTDNSFYNVIDVEFEESGRQLPEWKKAGQIVAPVDLKVGDVVYTRVFDKSGENTELSTTLEIESEQQGKAKTWSHELAQKINKENRYIKAGKVSDGEFKPEYGTNSIYINKSQGLTSVEIGFEVELPEASVSAEVTGVESEYIIGDNATTIEPVINVEGNGTVELTVYNHNRESLAYWTDNVKDGVVVQPSLELSKSEAGHHSLVVVTRNDDGRLVRQETLDFNLVGLIKFDYTYPDGFGSYKAGDVVNFEGQGVFECFGDWASHCNTETYLPGVAADPTWVSQQWNKVD